MHHHDSQVICKEIHVIVTWNGDCNLELPGQELGPVNGLRGVDEVGAIGVVFPGLGHLRVLHLRSHEFFPIQPNVIVSARLRGKKVSNILRQFLAVHVLGLVLEGDWRSHDVAVHISTSSQGRSHRLNDRAKDGLQVFLQYTVQLVGLPRGESQSPVSIQVGEVVHRLVQLIGDQPGRLLRPHHELIVFPSSERSLFTVVLLIRSMELHELRSRVCDEGFFGDELFHERMPQEVAVFFDDLHLGPLGLARGRGFGRCCYGHDRLHVSSHSTS
mmetsp:Transcript_11580/g.71234  ORF Transcript_11580/g.71234 Transcript_11580/m.71234 type:complete len:272 (+) Transcript_11580:1874-2689(+)